MSMLRELINYPTDYDFKIIGNNNDDFKKDVDLVFKEYEKKELYYKLSSEAKYVSINITVHIKNFEELEALYNKISKIKDLKYSM